MGSVFRKITTRPLPEGAELFTRRRKVTTRLPNGTRQVDQVTEQCARWKDAREKTRVAIATTAQDGSPRIRQESSTYFAKYRDHDGIVRVVPTGCRDETNAQAKLDDLEGEADLVRRGFTTSAAVDIKDHMAAPIRQHIDAYIARLAAVPMHKANTRRYLDRLLADCGWSRLRDLKQADLELWLASQGRPGEDGRPVRSARSRNTHRAAAVAFCNWLVNLKPPRMTVNPFEKIPLANEEADPRRKRRALTEEEIGRLLDVARRRPLLDAQTIRRGPQKGQPLRRLKPATVARLEALGRQRVMIYKTLLLTGLRKGELAELKVADLNLDGPVPHIQLGAALTKNHEEDFVTVRADLIADLRAWLVERFGPGTPPDDGRLFDVGTQFIQILNRDLKLAKIPKRDAQGRQIDVHALRTTFGTRLSKYGVAPRVAQRLMRHSKLELTMKVYTDARLFDLKGAVDSVPSVAPSVAPTPDALVQPESSPGNPAENENVA